MLEEEVLKPFFIINLMRNGRKNNRNIRVGNVATIVFNLVFMNS